MKTNSYLAQSKTPFNTKLGRFVVLALRLSIG